MFDGEKDNKSYLQHCKKTKKMLNFRHIFSSGFKFNKIEQQLFLSPFRKGKPLNDNCIGSVMFQPHN